MRYAWIAGVFLAACGNGDAEPAAAPPTARPATPIEPIDADPDPTDPPLPVEEIVKKVRDLSPEQQDQAHWQLFRYAQRAAVATDIQLRLEAGGRLSMRDENTWRVATLDDVTRRLRKARPEGGYDTDESDNPRVSRLFVGLDLHAATPWLHVVWLVTVCMEEHFDKLQLRVGDRTRQLLLPWDAAIEFIQPLPHVHARVRVQVRDEVEAPWGAVLVRKPTVLVYRVEGREAGFAAVAAYLDRARRGAEEMDKLKYLVGVPRWPAQLPVDRALDLLDAFAAAGIPRFDLGLAIPRDEDRRVSVLRHPRPAGD